MPCSANRLGSEALSCATQSATVMHHPSSPNKGCHGPHNTCTPHTKEHTITHQDTCTITQPHPPKDTPPHTKQPPSQYKALSATLLVACDQGAHHAQLGAAGPSIGCKQRCRLPPLPIPSQLPNPPDPLDHMLEPVATPLATQQAMGSCAVRHVHTVHVPMTGASDPFFGSPHGAVGGGCQLEEEDGR